MCRFFNAPRASRAPPQARAGGKRRREEKFVFLTHTCFIKRMARAGGERKRPHQGPHRRAPGETAPPGDRPRGFGDARGRIAISLIGIARAARGRLLWTPVGGLAQNTARLKKQAFRKCFDPSCYGASHATRRTRFCGKAPRAKGHARPIFRFANFSPSLPPYVFLSLPFRIVSSKRRFRE